MAKGFKHGTGCVSPLNFQVVGGATQPDSPKENTIWVQTSQTITGWVFRGDQPTGQDGLVWICTDNSGSASFNALKKNEIQVCPVSAHQYSGGKWVDRQAKLYTGGSWVNWKTYLFKSGTGLVNVSTNSWGEDYSSSSVSADAITVSYTAQSEGFTSIATKSSLDLSKYTRVCVEATTTETHGSTFAQRFGFTTFAHASGYDTLNWSASQTYTANRKRTTYTLDISKLDGKYYFWFTWGAAKSTIHNVWLE